MRITFFPRLAWTGIRNNRKLYLPYILSCIGMVMMYYILHALSLSPLMQNMTAGNSMAFVLALGKFVVAAFALLFLFYTNSFLIRRRYKEFGLYNVLGMDKRSICKVIFWETLLIALLGIAFGLIFGIAFSKFAEMGLLRAIHRDVDYHFSIPFKAVWMTAVIYGIIFALLLLRGIWQVSRSRVMELLRSENSGEKPPKSNWLLAVIGLLLLIGAYYLAISIQSPLAALVLFFVAVLMVIAATYLLFISGSVAFCRLLQKNKRYYYKANHFVSLSSMVFRMKRNGAGLASICILSTMVLVMISSTTSLYFGTDDAIASMFPLENYVVAYVPEMERFTEENLQNLDDCCSAVFEEYGVAPEKSACFRYASIAGLQSGSKFEVDSTGYQYEAVPMDNLRQVFFISVSDYARSIGETITLSEGEARVCCLGCEFPYDSFSMNGVKMKVVGTIDQTPNTGDSAMITAPTVYFVIPDYAMLRPLSELKDSYGDPLLNMRFYFGYDLKGRSNEVIEVYNAVRNSILDLDMLKGDNGFTYSSDCLELAQDEIHIGYGGLFFLGIMLSIVFCFAGVLIIYYKQVCEGYEDQARFEIMQKVGMTEKDIRKSVNSQVLTVFYAPLLFAGLHLAFAYPLIWKILKLFHLSDLNIVITITVSAFLVFGLLYTAVYKITAGAYYSIVSTREHA